MGRILEQLLLGVGPAGHAILAFLPPEEAKVVLAANAQLYPSFNNLTAEEVEAQLPDIRGVATAWMRVASSRASRPSPCPSVLRDAMP